MKLKAPKANLPETWVLWVVVWVFFWPLLLAWWILHRPLLLWPVAAFLGLALWVGFGNATALASWAVIAGFVWWLSHRKTFLAVAWPPFRREIRRQWVYIRFSRWRKTMRYCDLHKREPGKRDPVPQLYKVQCSATLDRITVKMLPGQSIEHFEGRARELAASFNARWCRVREVPGRWQFVVLEFSTHDPLVEVVPALPIPKGAA